MSSSTAHNIKRFGESGGIQRFLLVVCDLWVLRRRGIKNRNDSLMEIIPWAQEHFHKFIHKMPVKALPRKEETTCEQDPWFIKGNEWKTNGDGVRNKDGFFAVVYFALSLPLSKGDPGPKGTKGYPGIPGLPVSIQTVCLFIFYFMPTMQDAC